jgi:hypothetical protein
MGFIRMWRAFVTAAVSALVLTAGCTATPEPPTVDTNGGGPSVDTSSPSPTKTANPTEPPEDFARRYIDVANTALTTGDVGDLEALGSAKCDFCKEMAQSLETFHDNGGSYQGDPTWHITDLGKPTGTTAVAVSMYIEVKPHKIVEKKGATPRPGKGQTLLFDMTLGKEDGQWKVTDLDVTGSG